MTANNKHGHVVAVKRYKDGGEAVQEYFSSRAECQEWINKQPQPKLDEFVWMIGSYDQ